MITNPDPSPTDQTEPVDATAQSESASQSDAAASPRRIQIGTQRAGVTPPSLAPKYQYVAPPAPRADVAAPADAAASTSDAAPPQGDAPAQGGGEPKPEGRGPRDGGRGRRDRRRDDKPRSFTDVLPPARRVAVPSIRGGLDEDLAELMDGNRPEQAVGVILGDAGGTDQAEERGVVLVAAHQIA
jgi:hypothetical protein